jgi:hypothetical protein
MPLSPAQLSTLRTDIQTNFSGVPAGPDGDLAIATAYSAPASPSFTVWRTAVTIEEIMSNGFVWTEIDALAAGKARIWQWMAQLGTINPSKLNVRQGLGDAFATASGTLGSVANGTGGIQPHLRRLALRGERLFATGTGSVPSPGTLVYEGAITPNDVQVARQG